MQGELNYWAETIMNPEAPSSSSPNDEIAKYQFRKGAQQALGGGETVSSEASGTVSAPKPIIKRNPQKKKAPDVC
jgi:hypothetical protein